jgi:spore maturation protein SpmA
LCTFQITTSSIAPSAVKSLKRVISLAGTFAILTTYECVVNIANKAGLPEELAQVLLEAL